MMNGLTSGILEELVFFYHLVILFLHDYSFFIHKRNVAVCVVQHREGD
jgi:hypothetical protein